VKNMEYYLNLNYKIEIIKDEAEGGYVLSIPDLKGRLTCAATLDQGIEMLEDAKRQWIIAAMESGYEIPEPNVLEDYSGQFKLRLPKSLHRELVEKSKHEGISMNQYCLYLLSKNSSSVVGRKKITPAINNLIGEADIIAQGDKKSATMADIFGAEGK